MFTQLYRSPSALARHLSAPYAQERARYLLHCANQGYSKATLLLKARELLWVARKLSAYGSLQVTIEQIETGAQGWHEREQACGQPLHIQWTRVRFIEAARAWLRFLGLLRPSVGPPPFAEHLGDYATLMERERGLAASTIRQRSQCIAQFLRWYGGRRPCLETIGLGDIDEYLGGGLAAGWCRSSVHGVAAVLRGFCRFGASRGWCSTNLADAIRGPRVYADEGLPLGPDWSEVQRLLATLETDRVADIRDRAILMLFALYGLRATEVAQLRLADFDWAQDLLHVRRVKGRGGQIYPLVSAVGNAVARYLKDGRPPSTRPNVFLTLVPPFRPLSRGAMYSLTCKRLTALQVACAHRGPHALRHACATHLVAEGLSLNAVGDHLGHRCTAATRIYAKVDLPGLRQVAAFDLGDLS